MHIPDGYLSPVTCAAMYAAAAPFWMVALRRVQRALSTRLVPLLSVCAAFSFVVMMFNLPLPGGTTGHAVGMAVTTIVLGPWASLLVLSLALLIQAVFFGDGGITAFGANCFNMAVVGSLVAHLVYRTVSGRSAITSPRRVVAAALAGYVAINTSALLAAIEFGLQPLLFHDASGAPLYAPYPLGIAVPAMMLGHLALAGLAEGILSAGVVAWLQHSDAALFKLNEPAPLDGWRLARPLWIGVAGFMIATPLGLLAAGTAWGEWGVEDFNKPEARQAMAMASRNVAPPEKAPRGMERLASLWTAPIPEYAPPFLKSPSFGYLLSATMGVGLVLAASLGLHGIVRATKRRDAASPES
ncbi:MAG: cobalt transporter CbiM [Verrucomicrobia bacterium]|nr:cobalt transporter CbiM [Verrucomicrobiota bacterium]